jgi:hypothetical protein
MESTGEPEAPTGPDERGGYADREQEETTPQTGGGHNVDAGGRAHTSLDEGHPAGDGERTDREVGGPVSQDSAA